MPSDAVATTISVPAPPGRHRIAISSPSRIKLALLILLSLAIITIRFIGPSDLMDNEQQLQSAYVMDVRVNHHWLCQKDETGAITSKPPLYTWLAVLVNLPLRHVSDLAMRIPSALATIAVVLLIFGMTRRMGDDAAFLAALTYLLSYCSARSAALARMDGICALTAILCAYAALHAWETRRGWIWFFLACAAATLAKGPPIALAGAAGLLAAIGIRTTSSHGVTNKKTWPVWLQFVIGIILFLALTEGWMALSIKVMGQAVYDKLFIEELVNQNTTLKGSFPLKQWYQPPAMLISRFLPWSIVALVALWRIFTHKSSAASDDMDTDQRRFELYIACWLVGGLVPFSISVHQRFDLLLPVVPPAAILAGIELSRWLHPWPRHRRIAAVALTVLIGLGAMVVKYDWNARNAGYVVMTHSVENLANTIDATAGPDFPLTHVDTPYALQFDRNTMQPLVSFQTAVELLRGRDAAFVAVCDIDSLQKELGRTPVNEVLNSPLHKSHIHIISNREQLAAEDHMAVGVGGLVLRSQGLRWIGTGENDFTFEGHGSVSITNTSPTALSVRIHAQGRTQARTIAPQTTADVRIGS